MQNRMKRTLAAGLFLLPLISTAQTTNDQKRLDFSYSANYRQSSIRWASTHDMQNLDRMFDYHLTYQSFFGKGANRVGLFASEDGCERFGNYSNRNFGLTFQSSSKSFNMNLTLSQQFHPWNAPDAGLRLKVDLSSNFK